MERARKANGESGFSGNAAQAKLTSKSRESELANNIAGSPMMAAQRQTLQRRFGSAVQLQGKEEEPLQGKFNMAQRVEEEEPLQGKLEAVQRVEEEEPLQRKPDHFGKR